MELFDPQHLQEVKLVMPEHNRHGQDASWQENKGHFKTQTEIVMEHLEKGEIVTGKRMFELHGIQDTRARLYAIKKSLIGTGKYIEEKRIPGANGSKQWRMIEQPNK